MINIPKTRVAIFLLLLAILTPIWAQEVSLEAMQALDEWRWGVVAYNDGLMGKALLAMERAVSLNPPDPRIREWLGQAYWRSGMEDAALKVWDELFDETETSAALKRRMEQLRRRLDGEEEIPIKDEWVPLANFRGVDRNIKYFQGPTSVRSFGDGSGRLLISSYANGELIELDANGTLLNRYQGGLEGFDHPYDILPVRDGRVLVSEFQADRISVVSMQGYNKGYRIESWGKSGRESGEFLGPQYLALSFDGEHVYISDWGNRRVSKWRLDGTHVLDIGADEQFSGFLGPSGIASIEESVYIADSLRGTVDVFDPAGNYIGPLITGLKAPEGLAIEGKHLLVADGSEIHRVDLASGAITLEASLGGGNHRITSVFPDDNGNLALSDFDADRIVLLTPLSTLYGGLDVTLDRVSAEAHPQMVVNLTIKDRSGKAISGLDSSNFRIFDNDLPIGEPELDWRSSEDQAISMVAVVDSSGSTDDVGTLFQGLDEMMESFTSGDELALIETSQTPVLYEVSDNTVPGILYQNMMQSPDSSPIWDEALRLATARLAPERKKKAIIALVTDAPGPKAFDRYGLIETARFMANNGIMFFPVYANENTVSQELNYIASQTGGEPDFLFRPEGSGQIIDNLRLFGVGRYTITWRTPHSSEFGRAFLPVSVEVIYINKSGRDEAGTFAPLQ